MGFETFRGFLLYIYIWPMGFSIIRALPLYKAYGTWNISKPPLNIARGI